MKELDNLQVSNDSWLENAHPQCIVSFNAVIHHRVVTCVDWVAATDSFQPQSFLTRYKSSFIQYETCSWPKHTQTHTHTSQHASGDWTSRHISCSGSGACNETGSEALRLERSMTGVDSNYSAINRGMSAVASALLLLICVCGVV